MGIGPAKKILFLTLLLTGCGQGAHPGNALPAEPAEVLVVPDRLSLPAGGEIQLAAQANDTAGEPVGGAHFQFRAEDPRVLRVSPLGLVTSLGPLAAQTHVVVASGRREKRVPVAVVPGKPHQLEIVSGDRQTVRAGESPREPLTLRVVDARRNPVAGAQLLLSSDLDGMTDGKVLTGPDGRAAITLAPASRAGDHSVAAATSGNAPLRAVFHLRVVPGPPVSIKLISATGAERLPVRKVPVVALQVIDRFGNPVPGVAVSATLGAVRGKKPTPMLARSDASGGVVVELPDAVRATRVTLQVDLPDTAAVRQSFDLKIPAPAK